MTSRNAHRASAPLLLAVDVPGQRPHGVLTCADEGGEVGVGDRVATPDIDADVDHPAPLAPLLVDVAVQEPLPLVGGAVAVVAVVAAGIAPVGEVAGQHRDVTWEGERGLAVVELEPGGFVALGTPSSDCLLYTSRCV